MPLTTGSLTAARSPNSSAKPIWCLMRGRSTAPRSAEDTLVTLSTCPPMRTNTLPIDCSLLYLMARFRSLRIAPGSAILVAGAYHSVGSGSCRLASGMTE